MSVEQLQQHLRASQTFHPGGIELTADLRDLFRRGEKKREKRLNEFVGLERLLRNLSLGASRHFFLWRAEIMTRHMLICAPHLRFRLAHLLLENRTRNL